MVRVGCVSALLALCLDEDLATKRDAVFAIANLGDTLDLQRDLLREGALILWLMSSKSLIF
jgi:hypothetical protein